jgi:release factor glutamine methyltransferase
VLARHVLGWTRAALIARGRDLPPAGFESDYRALVDRRVRREPIAFIVGHREFWNLDFEVTPDVLIPRPETELILEIATELASEGLVWRRMIDVGTGSGCLAVSLAVEFPASRVIATDVSRAALVVARRNAEKHGVQDRLQFVEGDLLEGVTQTAELIVSNPPYLSDSDVAALQPEVANYEPRQALAAGPDGLAAIRRLLAAAPARLAAGGRLIVEFGFGQDAAVASLAADRGWRVIEIRRDLQQIPRTIVLGR